MASRSAALSYSVSNDDYVSENLTTLANHITESGVVDMCWQQDPDRLLWVALGDGTLATLTLERNQEVIGWARHELDGGVVESLASIPGASEDVVFAVVARTINGAAVRYVEKFDRPCLWTAPSPAPAAQALPPGPGWITLKAKRCASTLTAWTTGHHCDRWRGCADAHGQHGADRPCSCWRD